ncbi:hypothetical protein D3C85_1609950 [compost metagenome]
MHRDSREDLLPEVRFVLVHDDERNHPGVQHLDQVLVFQSLWCFLEDDRRFAGHCGRVGTGDHHLADVAIDR